MPEISVFECYGHGKGGVAVVLAESRQQAVLACREWLGWDVPVAFRAPDKFVLWTNSGGTEQNPVVYAADEEHYEALKQRRADGGGL